MIRYNISVRDRLIHTGRDMRFVGRRNGELHFAHDRTGARLTLTDEELRAEIARGKARLVRADGGLNSGAVKRSADFTMPAEQEKEPARRRLAHVNEAHKAGPPKPKAPIDLVELDYSLCDLVVVDAHHRLPIGRPVVTVAADRCTRSLLGLYVGFEPPDVHSVMQCLRNGTLPKL